MCGAFINHNFQGYAYIAYSLQGGHGEIHVDDHVGGSPQRILSGEIFHGAVSLFCHRHQHKRRHNVIVYPIVHHFVDLLVKLVFFPAVAEQE